MNQEPYQPYSNQQPPYQQPTYPGQFQPGPSQPQPSRSGFMAWLNTESRSRTLILGCLLPIFILSCCIFASISAFSASQHNQIVQSTPTNAVANNSNGQSTPVSLVATVTATSAKSTAAPTAKKKLLPNLAVLGGTVYDFDLKFGKEDTSNGGIGYQPFGSYTSGQDLPTDKISIAVENGHVEGVTVTLPKESPLSWQDGTKFCRSFLPADAVFKSSQDFSPPTQEYQEVYMSKTMAQMFSADHFVAGGGVNPQPLTSGTLEIMYYYSSWYDHNSSGAQITSCDIELGEPS